MTALSDLVPSLKREVAVPGTFSEFYPDTTDTDLVGSLMDAFAAAQLEGFFVGQALDLDTQEISPDLSPAGTAVVGIYAAERILTAQIMNMRQRTLYEAGPVKYEIENSANVLAQILKQLAERKRQMLAMALEALRPGYGGGFAMGDLYVDRGFAPGVIHDNWFYPYELMGR
jgi:hypothetical protein